VTADVSLIMPTWRPRPDWLRQAVTSALDERACELELIVVDDGSDEPVEPLLADIDDPRVRVIRTPHGGPYAARNAGIGAARGRFLRFIDADDVVEPGSTGRLLALIADAGPAVAYGATLMCDETLAPQSVVTSELEGDVVEAAVMGAFHVFVVAILFPRSVVERAGPWNEHAFKVSGDWDFVLRALEHAAARRLDEVVTRYRRHGESVTKTAAVAAGANAGEEVLAGYFERHPEHRGTSLERRAYVRLHLDRASAHAWVREWRPAAAQLARAARRSPAVALAAGARWGVARLLGLMARAARRARRGSQTPA